MSPAPFPTLRAIATRAWDFALSVFVVGCLLATSVALFWSIEDQRARRRIQKK